MLPPKHPLPATGTPKPPPDKSKFLQTCSRLSQFIKEKGGGNIRDLNFKFDATGGVSAAKATTVDLLSSIDDEKSAKSPPPPPHHEYLDSSSRQVEEDWKAKSAQMTIFYEGGVLVLDEVPADRARDVMVMANRASKVAPPAVDVSGDLPIARRASLHKFLAKRKDRATVRHPYPYPSPGGSASSSAAANQQHSFDLNM